jgi:hypothetical protein
MIVLDGEDGKTPSRVEYMQPHRCEYDVSILANRFLESSDFHSGSGPLFRGNRERLPAEFFGSVRRNWLQPALFGDWSFDDSCRFSKV